MDPGHGTALEEANMGKRLLGIRGIPSGLGLLEGTPREEESRGTSGAERDSPNSLSGRELSCISFRV
jgi:hypothetical protein